jgi:proline racemase
MGGAADCHAEGESGKVVIGGIGDVPGETIFDKRVYFEDHLDALRRLLLFEPRGSVVQNANVVLPSNHPDAVLGYVILETTEYPAMSGSNTICVATALLETGMVPMTEPVTEFTLEAPAGLIHLRCECRDGKVTKVRFTNQPAFAYHLSAPIEVEGRGTLSVDVAWGGMAYVLVDAASLGFGLTPDEGRDLCLVGQEVKRAGAEQAIWNDIFPLLQFLTSSGYVSGVKGALKLIGRSIDDPRLPIEALHGSRLAEVRALLRDIPAFSDIGILHQI